MPNLGARRGADIRVPLDRRQGIALVATEARPILRRPSENAGWPVRQR
jgi:hypothetical protein